MQKFSGGYSIPEYFVLGVLTQFVNPDDIKPQYSPDWGQNKRYDYFLPKQNAIIEVHGAQHYQEVPIFKTRTLEEEIENDRFKRELAHQNGVINYAELDCSLSNINYMYYSLLENPEFDKILGQIDKNWKDKVNLKYIHEFIIQNKNGYEAVCEKYLETYQFGRIKTAAEIKDELEKNSIFLSTSSIDSCLRYAESAGRFTYFTPSMYKQRDIRLFSELFDKEKMTVQEIANKTQTDKEYVNNILTEASLNGVCKNFYLSEKEFTLFSVKVRGALTEISIVEEEKIISKEQVMNHIVTDSTHNFDFIKQQMSRGYMEDLIDAAVKIGDVENLEKICEKMKDENLEKLAPVTPIDIAQKLNIKLSILYALKKELFNFDEVIENSFLPEKLTGDCLKDSVLTTCYKLAEENIPINKSNVIQKMSDLDILSDLKETYHLTNADIITPECSSIIDRIKGEIEGVKMAVFYNISETPKTQFLKPEHVAEMSNTSKKIILNDSVIMEAVCEHNIKAMYLRGTELTTNGIAMRTGITANKLKQIIQSDKEHFKNVYMETLQKQRQDMINYLDGISKQQPIITINDCYELSSPSNICDDVIKKHICEINLKNMLKENTYINYPELINRTQIPKDFIYESHGKITGTKDMVKFYQEIQTDKIKKLIVNIAKKNPNLVNSENLRKVLGSDICEKNSEIKKFLANFNRTKTKNSDLER